MSSVFDALAVFAAAIYVVPATRRLAQILILAAGAAVFVGFYLLACRIWPYADCPRCTGSGKSGSPTRKSFRNCPRCKGTGRRTRLGRRLLDRHSNH